MIGFDPRGICQYASDGSERNRKVVHFSKYVEKLLNPVMYTKMGDCFSGKSLREIDHLNDLKTTPKSLGEFNGGRGHALVLFHRKKNTKSPFKNSVR